MIIILTTLITGHLEEQVCPPGDVLLGRLASLSLSPRVAHQVVDGGSHLPGDGDGDCAGGWW